MYFATKYSLEPPSISVFFTSRIMNRIFTSTSMSMIGRNLTTHEEYMYSSPVICCIYSTVTRFIAPPSGDARPPSPVAYAIVRSIFDAVLFVLMSSIPIYLSMAIAIGVIVAHTTAFGSTADRTADNTNQNTSCILKLLPISLRNVMAILLSSPVFSHITLMMEAPRRSSIVSSA